jgi:hypothetical protein
MPVAQTYASLLEDTRRYLERGFTAASDPDVFVQLPKLVNLAERRAARELKIQGFQTVVASTMQAGLAVYPKPVRWRQTISVNWGSGTLNNTRNMLYPRSYEYIRMYWPDQTTQMTATDEMAYYADYDYQNWIFAATPDAAYPFEVLYYQNPEFLDDATQTNWLTEHAPELLVYGTLLEATPFLKDDQRIQVWQGMYDRAASSVNGEDLQKILDRSSTRAKP